VGGLWRGSESGGCRSEPASSTHSTPWAAAAWAQVRRGPRSPPSNECCTLAGAHPLPLPSPALLRRSRSRSSSSAARMRRPSRRLPAQPPAPPPPRPRRPPNPKASIRRAGVRADSLEGTAVLLAPCPLASLHQRVHGRRCYLQTKTSTPTPPAPQPPASPWPPCAPTSGWRCWRRRCARTQRPWRRRGRPRSCRPSPPEG